MSPNAVLRSPRTNLKFNAYFAAPIAIKLLQTTVAPTLRSQLLHFKSIRSKGMLNLVPGSLHDPLEALSLLKLAFSKARHFSESGEILL